MQPNSIWCLDCGEGVLGSRADVDGWLLLHDSHDVIVAHLSLSSGRYGDYLSTRSSGSSVPGREERLSRLRGLGKRRK